MAPPTYTLPNKAFFALEVSKPLNDSRYHFPDVPHHQMREAAATLPTSRKRVEQRLVWSAAMTQKEKTAWSGYKESRGSTLITRVSPP